MEDESIDERDFTHAEYGPAIFSNNNRKESCSKTVTCAKPLGSATKNTKTAYVVGGRETPWRHDRGIYRLLLRERHAEPLSSHPDLSENPTQPSTNTAKGTPTSNGVQRSKTVYPVTSHIESKVDITNQQSAFYRRSELLGK